MAQANIVSEIDNDDLWAERGNYWIRKLNPVPYYKAQVQISWRGEILDVSGGGQTFSIGRPSVFKGFCGQNCRVVQLLFDFCTARHHGQHAEIIPHRAIDPG